MATSPPPPGHRESGADPDAGDRAGLGSRRAGRQTRGGGKASSREDEEASDPLLDRNAGRRDRSVWRRTRHAGMLAALRAGGPWFLPRSPLARMVLAIATALLLLLVVITSARAAVGKDGFVVVPPYAARVTDQARMLTSSQRTALEGVLADYEARSGSQIAVLLMSSTAPESIEQYSIRVAEAWKLGRKGVDDGVLLLVAKDNPSALRRLRIEAGRGVQGSLTDAQSKRVLQDVIAPHFRQGDYYGGLAAGVSAIATLIDKERLPAPPGASGRAGPQAQPGVQPGVPPGAAPGGSGVGAGASPGAGSGAAGGGSPGTSDNAGLGRLAEAAGAGAIGGTAGGTSAAPGAPEGDAPGGSGTAVGDAAGTEEAGRRGGDGAEGRGVSGGGGGFGWLLPLVFVAAGFFLLKGRGRSSRALHRGGWGRDATGVLIGAALGHAMSNAGARGWGHGGGGFGGGGFGGGGGGTFDGGGASGDW